jgi:DNA-directed RNA polymerase subunit alpha
MRVCVTSLKIKGVEHEFGAIEGVMEDVIQIILNMKKLRFRSFSPEPVIVNLVAKKEGEVTGENIELPTDVELINPEQFICTISGKKTTLEMELTIEKGRGYVSAEQRQKDKLPIGVIAVDAVYSPVRMVNFTIDDVRVGQRIDFNKVTMEIETDGSMSPEQALKEASSILMDHFSLASQVSVPESSTESTPKKAKKKKSE